MTGSSSKRCQLEDKRPGASSRRAEVGYKGGYVCRSLSQHQSSLGNERQGPLLDKRGIGNGSALENGVLQRFKTKAVASDGSAHL